MRFIDLKLSRILLAACCGLGLLFSRALAAAQQPDEPAAEAAAFEAADEDAPQQNGKADKKNQSAAAPTVSNDPAVLTVLESHPSSPAELLRAIAILVDLGQPKLAKPWVDQLLAQKLDMTAKAALATQFPSATLLKLAHHPELAAALGPLIDDLLKSAEAFRRDPQRLAEWARQLGDADDSVRAGAFVALLRAREAAVAPLIALLVDPNRAAEHGAARAMLVHLDGYAVAPLLGVLECPDAALKAQVVEVLGQLKAGESVAPILAAWLSPASSPALRAASAEALRAAAGQVPNQADALHLLEHAVRRPLELSLKDDPDQPAQVEVWHWNARQKQSMPITYDANGAALANSTRLARELFQLDPANAAYRRLYLIALLQSAKYRHGLDKPLPTGATTAYAIAARQGAEAIEDALSAATSGGFLPAATAAAQILGEIGSSALLARNGSTLSPLARAAQSADRRLRFAAIDAILRLDPRMPFAGSTHVVDGLGFFASSFGEPRALIAHPRSDEAQKLAGLAALAGFDADIATNGRKAFELATASPDYEFMLIHSAIDRPRADVLLAQLRRDRRAALVPVGLMAPLDDLDRVGRFADKNPRCQALLQPQNEAEMKLFSAQLVARAGRGHVGHEERRAQAIAALDWLIRIGDSQQRVFDLHGQESAIEHILFLPELSERAATVLGMIGGPKAQLNLIELADLTTQPKEVRAAAVAALGQSIREHGLLLAREQIMHQYDLYNANAGGDADTHAILGALLDLFEHKDQTPHGH